jgi:hypothetical protein
MIIKNLNKFILKEANEKRRNVGFFRFKLSFYFQNNFIIGYFFLKVNEAIISANEYPRIS